MKLILPAAGLLVLWCVPLRSADFQGADAVLKKLAENQEKPTDAAQPADPVDVLRKKITVFRQEAPTLAPDKAAAQWLALFDAFTALPQAVLNNPRNVRNWRDRLTMQSLLEALPPSSDWDALGKAMDARTGGSHEVRDGCLRVLAAILRGDAAARNEAIASLRKTVEKAPLEDFHREMFRGQLDVMDEFLSRLTAEGAERVALFEKELTRHERHEPSRNNGDDEGRGAITVPDLVKLAGREKAEGLLQRALDLELELYVQGEATHRLAVSLALKSIAKRKTPLWSLVTEVDDAPLYEQLVKLFPTAPTEELEARRQADAIYLVSLIANNRSKDAAAFLLQLPAHGTAGRSFLDYGETDYLVRKGLIGQVRNFLGELLAKDPSLPYWQNYIELSAKLGEADKALAFLREVVSRPDLSPEAKLQTDEYYSNALLAADQVDEGLKVLRALIQAGPRVGATSGDTAAAELRRSYERVGAPLTAGVSAQMLRSARWFPDNGLQKHVDDCLRLAQLGRLLERPDLVDEGVNAAEAALAKENANQASTLVHSITSFLLKVNRGAEAEKLIVDEQFKDSQQGAYLFAQSMAALVGIYHRAGRYDDVLMLLNSSPYWGATDLSSHATLEGAGVPVLYAAAKALAVAGKKDEARRVAERLLEEKGGYDPAYALLLELGGEGLEARLDALAQRDRFEERPLIWKARLQLNAGRVEEAEKTVRAAIAIDPSDGEEGKGDRMRAYAVLGDVLEKKGDRDQAKIMRGAVEAIRLSENADDWWEAGLLTRAVKMYEEALGHFADAYCIQSRLALRYSELGDYAKAEQHYRRAFELMPDSFGRIESHCFGCEGAFSGERAQNIADRVFTQLAVKTPTKPQVFYLLGYLREQQHREEEAAAQFQQATKLDPDYFNAWEKLYQLPEDAMVPQPEIEAAVLAMLRLDPILRHHSGDFQKVRNLRALWDAVLAAEKTQPPVSNGPIYPLAAAKVEQERRAKAAREARRPGFDPYSMDRFMPRTDVRQQFAQHPLLSTLTNILETFSQRK